jgi:hypothetical protein
MQAPAMPKAAEPRSLTSLHEKRIKISVKVARQWRYVTCQHAEVAVVLRQMFQNIQMFHNIVLFIARLRAPPESAVYQSFNNLWC